MDAKVSSDKSIHLVLAYSYLLYFTALLLGLLFDFILYHKNLVTFERSKQTVQIVFSSGAIPAIRSIFFKTASFGATQKRILATIGAKKIKQ